MARRERRPDRRASVRARLVRFVRAIFGGGSSGRDSDDARRDEPPGGIGTREPRRPLRPSRSGAVALEAPPDDRRDTRAVGSDS